MVPDSLTMAGVERWKFVVVGYALRLNPSFREMENFVRMRWNLLGNIEVHRMSSGIFVFNCSSEEDKLEIIERGPGSFSRRPLILKPCAPGMSLAKKKVSKLPIRVQFPLLTLDLWNAESLSMLSSQLGLSYARACIEIDVEADQFEEVEVEYANGIKVMQRVVFECLPQGCKKCKMFGHMQDKCTTRLEYLPMKRNGVDNRKSTSVVKNDEGGHVGNEVIPTGGKVVVNQVENESRERMKAKGPVNVKEKKEDGVVIGTSRLPQLDSRFKVLNIVEESADEGTSQHSNEEGEEGLSITEKIMEQKRSNSKKKQAKKKTRGRLQNIDGYPFLEYQVVTDKCEFFLSAMYGFNHHNERLDLWRSLSEARMLIRGRPWILGGDFNITRFSDEAMGSPSDREAMNDFNLSIEEIEVDDLVCRGHKFTWCANWREQHRSILRKLDRVLGNEAWMRDFPTCEVYIESPSVSNHCRLKVMVNNQIPSCPKLFRYQKFWQQHET
ncbi:hypothetical protein Leryth_027147 [Lithospermum erythrorhizon]|nr:hypothetical protein Leryth_027147 [Lithospermum erythrorhizon]